MKTLLHLVALVVLAGSVPGLRAEQLVDPSNHDRRMAWFREAKFGLFIHWGLYALPAGQWQGQRVRGLGEWIMHNARIPVSEYAKLAPDWNPTAFDADAWVQLAKAAGMKYVVFTAKHHDGFALYHSRVSRFNVVDATPFGRDPLRELAEACARHGLRLGVYYSQAQDWAEPGGLGNDWDFASDAEKDRSGAFDEYLRRKAEPQVRELLTNYGSLGMIWFDTPHLMTPERGQRFVDLVRTLQPDCLIDGRLGAAGDYVTMDDNTIPHQHLDGDWETPATLNHTWGYRSDDQDWKSASEVLFKLVDIVSKGGNYLLNVGPDATGVIPLPAQATLRVVGDWLQVHGEAIYGAGPSPFGPEFGEFSPTQRDRHGQPVFLSRATWRCTTQPGKLFFTYFGDRRSTVELPPFANAIRRAYVLADPERSERPIELINGVRTAWIFREGHHATANVLCVEIEGEAVAR